jgi:hypothetical protein
MVIHGGASQVGGELHTLWFSNKIAVQAMRDLEKMVNGVPASMVVPVWRIPIKNELRDWVDVVQNVCSKFSEVGWKNVRIEFKEDKDLTGCILIIEDPNV